MNVWLDDIRPAPDGWVWFSGIEGVKEVLLTGQVEELSLDHDLGACPDCMQGKTLEEWLARTDGQSMPHCSHVGTGYDLVCWMEANDIWPLFKPKVHSANPVGRQKMLVAIERSFPREK